MTKLTAPLNVRHKFSSLVLITAPWGKYDHLILNGRLPGFRNCFSITVNKEWATLLTHTHLISDPNSWPLLYTAAHVFPEPFPFPSTSQVTCVLFLPTWSSHKDLLDTQMSDPIKIDTYLRVTHVYLYPNYKIEKFHSLCIEDNW